MSDLIDRQAAIDAIITLWTDKPFGNPALTEIKECIDNLPSAQPERKTGRWERKMDGVYCSACHKGWGFIMGVPADVETKYRYCPNCGAKMEVEHEAD